MAKGARHSTTKVSPGIAAKMLGDFSFVDIFREFVEKISAFYDK